MNSQIPYSDTKSERDLNNESLGKISTKRLNDEWANRFGFQVVILLFIGVCLYFFSSGKHHKT